MPYSMLYYSPLICSAYLIKMINFGIHISNLMIIGQLVGKQNQEYALYLFSNFYSVTLRLNKPPRLVHENKN